MDARVRESQIERGWLAHEPERARIPREIGRQLHTFKRVIAPVAARVEAASNDRECIAGLLYDYVRKSDVGRARALAKVLAAAGELSGIEGALERRRRPSQDALLAG